MTTSATPRLASNIGQDSTYNNRQCPFCESTFSRVDAARRHALRCARREGRPLHPKQRGRRAQACDECSRLKVHCDRRLPNPCQRCVSRKLECTFDQARASANIPPQLVLAEELQDPQNHERNPTSLTFLLNSTDDRQDFFTEKTIGDEPDRPLLGPTCLTASRTHSPMDGLLDFFDPSLMPTLDMDSLFMPLELNGFFPTDELSPLDSQPFMQPSDALLSARLETLEAELTAQACKPHLQTSFDGSSYRDFFSVPNVESFAAMFCRKRHYQYPIIHWPTFALEEASLPLLLAVTLTGAAYSLSKEHGTKYIAEARRFYQLADSYIFDQLDATVGGSNACSLADTLQACQAALLMYGLEVFTPSNSAMRDVAINRRLPTLISTLRRLDFITCRHEASEDWQLFLQREQVIRLVSWTYCVDCLATLVFNKPPGFSLLEMSGSLPCDPNLWEADSVMSYEALHNANQHTHHSLIELMKSILDDDLSTSRKSENAPTFHLHVMLFAFQHHIYNLQVTMTLKDQSTKLLHSLQTWRQHWQRSLSTLSDGDRQSLGVAKHVCDVEYLTRRIVEVAVSSDSASSPYLRRTPTTSTRLIHDFIRDHASGQD